MISRKKIIPILIILAVSASILVTIAPANSANQPTAWVKAPANVTYTDHTYTITWSKQKADQVVLYYVLNGKEYSITKLDASTTSYTWNPPDQPDPSNPYKTVFHYVRIKALWRDRIGDVYKNVSTAYSDYFTLAKPGAFVIATQSLPPATVGEQYSFRLKAEGGETPYSWNLVAGYSLPPGLTLSLDGLISGRPQSTASRNVRVHALDSGVDALSDNIDLVMTVAEPGATPTPTPGPFDYRLEMSDSINTTTIDRPATGQTTAHKTLNVRWSSGIPQSVTLDVTGCPTGLDCSFSPRTGSPFFSSAMNISVHNTLAPGTYPIVVHATTGTGMERTLTYTVVVTSEATAGDLILERPYELYDLEANRAIVPMQVFNMSPYLIKGKNTIFKATIRSTFNTDMDVRVELWLPTEDWDWEGMPHGSSVDIHTQEMGIYRFPEHYVYNRTITVPANSAVEVFLPEPSWLTEETIHSSPHMWMDELTIVTNAPRPKHSGGADYFDEPEYTVIVDPWDRIAESSELNNCPYRGTEWMQTYPTASLNMLLSPVISDNYEIGDFWSGGVTGTAFENDFRDNIRPQAQNSSEFMLGVYPIADDKLSYYLSNGVMTFHEHGGDSNHFYMQQDMSDMAAENGYDRIVGMVPEGFGDSGWDDGEWLGVVFGHNPRACFVMIDRNLTTVMVHENYHNLGYGDVYGDGVNVFADDSYWLNRQRARTVAGDDLRDYMEYVGYDHYWTSQYRYDRVMRTLPNVEDPEVLLFRCVVNKNGSVELSPFMVIDGKPDTEPGEWNYKIVLKDAGGNVVREQKEDVSFTMSVAAAKGNGGTMPYDMAFISAMVPWSNNVTLVELQDKAGNVVASRAVSKNPPSVQFTAPAAGDVWEYGGSYKLKWTASDPDGDPLNFSLAMSTDKTAWIPVAIDIASNEYTFDTGTVTPGNYYFRVRATDGVLSTNDTMEQSIRITGESSLPAQPGTATPTSTSGQAGLPGSTLLIGGVIAIVLIVVVIGAALLVIRSKK
jgi:hypothetical protein